MFLLWCSLESFKGKMNIPLDNGITVGSYNGQNVRVGNMGRVRKKNYERKKLLSEKYYFCLTSCRPQLES